MTDRRKYQQEYYKKRKEVISKYKRDKYKVDADYRDKAKHRSSIQASLNSITKVDKQVTVTHNGKEETAYVLGYISKLIDRERTVIYYWRKKGLIPEALYYTEKEKPLYSFSQVSFIATLLKKVDTGDVRLSYKQMRFLLQSVWHKTFSEKELDKQIGGISAK